MIRAGSDRMPVNLLSMFAILAVAVGLSGCGTNMSPNFSRMSSSYAQSLAQYQTDSILANIVRASEERPLSFLDIPSINGSGNVSQAHSASLSLGGLEVSNFYGAIASASPSASVSFGTAFNFTQSSLDNATFWTGFLTKAQLKGIAYFRNAHVPKEVMFALIIESIDIENADGSVRSYFNSPLEPDYDQFIAIYYDLLNDGLDIVAAHDTAAPPANEKNSNGQPQQPTLRLCLATKNLSHRAFSANMYCDNADTPSLTAAETKSFTVRFRSPKHIFSYLGDVLRAQNLPDPIKVTLKPIEGTRNRKRGESDQYTLLVVRKNPDAMTETYAVAEGAYGDGYAIPRENNGYSPVVIDVLSQMIVLNKIAGSIPQQPAVLVR